MRSPTARVLTVLDLLQSRKIGGRELACGLEVYGRTVRRYVTTLQETEIPVEGPSYGMRSNATLRRSRPW